MPLVWRQAAAMPALPAPEVRCRTPSAHTCSSRTATRSAPTASSLRKSDLRKPVVDHAFLRAIAIGAEMERIANLPDVRVDAVTRIDRRGEAHVHFPQGRSHAAARCMNESAADDPHCPKAV